MELTNDKQRKIDRICTKVCRWKFGIVEGIRTHDDKPIWAWIEPSGRFHKDFDPFTNPGHCARVMDDVYRLGWYYKGHSPFQDGEPFQGGLTPKGATRWNGRPDFRGEGTTEPEAKMNAVWAMLEGK